LRENTQILKDNKKKENCNNNHHKINNIVEINKYLSNKNFSKLRHNSPLVSEKYYQCEKLFSSSTAELSNPKSNHSYRENPHIFQETNFGMETNSNSNERNKDFLEVQVDKD